MQIEIGRAVPRQPDHELAVGRRRWVATIICARAAPKRPSASLAATSKRERPRHRTRSDADRRLRGRLARRVDIRRARGQEPRAVARRRCRRSPRAPPDRYAAHELADLADHHLGCCDCTDERRGPTGRGGKRAGPELRALRPTSVASSPDCSTLTLRRTRRASTTRARHARAHLEPHLCARIVTRSAARVVGMPLSSRPNGLRSWSYCTISLVSCQRAAAMNAQRREHLVDADERHACVLVRVAIGVVAVVAHARERVMRRCSARRRSRTRAGAASRSGRDRIGVEEAAIEVRGDACPRRTRCRCRPLQAPVRTTRRSPSALRSNVCDGVARRPGMTGSSVVWTMPSWFSSTHCSWSFVGGVPGWSPCPLSADTPALKCGWPQNAPCPTRRRSGRRSRSCSTDPCPATARRRPARRSSRRPTTARAPYAPCTIAPASSCRGTARGSRSAARGTASRGGSAWPRRTGSGTGRRDLGDVMAPRDVRDLEPHAGDLRRLGQRRARRVASNSSAADHAPRLPSARRLARGIRNRSCASGAPVAGSISSCEACARSRRRPARSR